MKWLKTIDYFGVNAELRVNSKKKYKTKFGGGVFLTWVSAILSYILYSFILWVTKQNCISYYSNQIILPSPKINLKSLNFMAGIALMYENYSIANSEFDEFLNFDFIHEITFDRNKAYKIKEKIPLKKCNFSDFETIDKSSFNKLNISEYLCPQEINRTIEGLFTDNVYSLVKFVVSIKKNIMENNEKFKLLNEFLLKNTLRLNIYFIDTSIDISNISQPITHYINNFFTFIDMMTYKRIHLEFMLSEFIDDNSLWFKTENPQPIIKYNHGREYFFGVYDRQLCKNEDSHKFVTFYLRSYQNILIIKREYQKLSIFLASISSVLSSSLLLLLVFMKLINDYFLNQYLIFKTIFFKEDIMNNAELRKNLKLITEEVKKSLLNNRFLVNNVFENTKLGNEKFTFNLERRVSRSINDPPAVVQLTNANSNKIYSSGFNTDSYFQSGTINNLSKNVPIMNNYDSSLSNLNIPQITEIHRNGKIDTKLDRKKNSVNSITNSKKGQIKRINSRDSSNTINVLPRTVKNLNNATGSERISINDANQIKFLSKSKKNLTSNKNESRRFNQIRNQNSMLKLINDENFPSINEKTNISYATEMFANKPKESAMFNTKAIYISNNENDIHNDNINNEIENLRKEQNDNYNGLNQLKYSKSKTIFHRTNKDFDKTKILTDNFKEEYISKFKLRRSNTLKLSTCDILLNFMFCKLFKKKKIENKIFNQGNKKINYYLDVLTIIKKLQELELIKRIIFDLDQQALINFLSKPLISVFDCNYRDFGSNKNDFFSFEKMLKLEKNINSEDLETMYNSYKNLLNDETKDEMNINLIKIFETKIKYLF